MPTGGKQTGMRIATRVVAHACGHSNTIAIVESYNYAHDEEHIETAVTNAQNSLCPRCERESYAEGTSAPQSLPKEVL